MIIFNKKYNIFFIVFIQIFVLFLFENPIHAHQPFGIKDKNKENYIEISDATVSHAFYGEFSKKDEEMILKFTLNQGELFDFSLLIPNQEPEKLNDLSMYPILIVNDEKFTPNQTSTFHEPYSNMDFIRILSERQNIEQNTDITVKVISRGRTRYVFSIGYKEIFNNTYASGNVMRLNMNDLNEWYDKLYTPEAKSNFPIILGILIGLTIFLSLIMYYRHDIKEKFKI
jgi:hypothetical protein